VLGGQSGSGKSTLHKYIQSKNANCVVVDGDTFRQQHPHFEELVNEHGPKGMQYTSEFSGRMIDEIVTELSDRKYNLIVEGTLRTSEVPLHSAQLFKAKGYHVELYVMVVKPELSYLSTILRYEQMRKLNPLTARATPKAHHDLIIEKMPTNLNELYQSGVFDEIILMNRNNEILYQMTETPVITPKLTLEEHWFRDFEPREFEMFNQSADMIMELLKGREVSDEEYKVIYNAFDAIESQKEVSREEECHQEKNNDVPPRTL
jgi:UDP-N-acetylglucosamine kinase